MQEICFIQFQFKIRLKKVIVDVLNADENAVVTE